MPRGCDRNTEGMSGIWRCTPPSALLTSGGAPDHDRRHVDPGVTIRTSPVTTTGDTHWGLLTPTRGMSMVESSVQTEWKLDSDDLDGPTRNVQLPDGSVSVLRALLGLVKGLRARFTDGRRSHHSIGFDDRHSAAALIGLYGMKRG